MTNWFRELGSWAAYAAGAGFVLAEIGYAFAFSLSGGFADVAGSARYQAASWVLLMAAALAIPAVMAVHREHAAASGIAGVPAAVVLGMAMAMLIGLAWTSTFVDPYLATAAPQLFTGDTGLRVGADATYIALVVGALLYAAVTWRANVFPRWMAALLALAGLAVLGVPPFVETQLIPSGSTLLLGFAFASLGLGVGNRVVADEQAQQAVDGQAVDEPPADGPPVDA